MESEKQIPELAQPNKNEGTSFLRACFNTANTLSGVGILSVPYALSKGGWVGLLLLLIVAGVCFYTGILLDRCMAADPEIKSYPDIGRLAFGEIGRLAITTFLYLELFLLAVEFLIMEADNLHQLIPKEKIHLFGMVLGLKKVFIFMTGVVVLPTTLLKDLKVLSYVSATGVISTLLLIFIVLWGGVMDDIGFHGKGHLCIPSGLTTAASLFTFCFLGHAVFPSIRHSMRKKAQFPMVLLVCFLLSTISYVSMAILGYIIFGDELLSQVTLNMPKKNVSSKIAIITTLALPLTKYSIIMDPIATMVEMTSFLQGMWMRRYIFRTCLVLGTIGVAIFVPFFGHVMALIGAFVGVTLSILFPCICYWKIVLRARSFGLESAVILFIVLAGMCVLLLGTFTAVLDIIKDF